MLRRALLLAAIAQVAAGEEAEVRIDNFTFAPDTLTVPAGTRVVWTNRDDIPHSVVDAERPPRFKSPVLDTDEAFARSFDTPGRYTYFCGLHPHMTGMVIVT